MYLSSMRSQERHQSKEDQGDFQWYGAQNDRLREVGNDDNMGSSAAVRSMAASPPNVYRGIQSGGAFAPAQAASVETKELERLPQAQSEAPLPQQVYAESVAHMHPTGGSVNVSHYDGSQVQPHQSGLYSQLCEPEQARWFRPVSSFNETLSLHSPGERGFVSSPVSATSTSALHQSLSFPTTPLGSPSSRFRPASVASMESMESCESHSSYGSSHGNPRGISSSKKKPPRKLSSSPPHQASEESKESQGDKSPLPQNLRGDPFRSAKVKTELCRHFGSAKGCPFGDKCNYAHGEHELKYTKLMDLERAGLVDIEIFRTHPCPTWVATGACPFDQRCAGLHDPRVAGSHQSWLPHAETLINSIGESVNVDKLYHQRLSSIYSCSPLYGYIPHKRWKSDPPSTKFAWKHFYAFVCNLDESISSPATVDHHRPAIAKKSGAINSEAHSPNESLLEYHRIAIVLKMREKNCGQCYAYLPSHLFCGELCMVLQMRKFRLQNRGDSNADPEEVSENINDGSIESTAPQLDSRDVIVVHEIAFGPVGDPSVRQLSVWFNIPPTDIVPCTPQQAKRHKRSRHRLKKNRSRDTSKPSTISLPSSSPLSQEAPKFIDSCHPPPFYTYYPVDNTTFELVTGILKHRACVLRVLSLTRDITEIPLHMIHSLSSDEQILRTSFESLRRHWMTWAWPVNLGRGQVSNDTDVPPVNGAYHFLVGDNNFNTDAFYGVDDGKGTAVVPHRSALTVGFIWRSFVINMQLLSRSKHSHDFKADIGVMPLHDQTFQNLRRLPVFRWLSMGISVPTHYRTIPHIRNRLSMNEITSHYPGYQPYATALSLLADWESVQSHYKKKQTSPLRSSQAAQEHSSGRNGVVLSNDASPQFKEGYSEEIHNAAQMWTRMQL